MKADEAVEEAIDRFRNFGLEAASMLGSFRVGSERSIASTVAAYVSQMRAANLGFGEP